MSLLVEKTPQKTVNGLDTKAFASKSQAPYKGGYYDTVINSVETPSAPNQDFTQISHITRINQLSDNIAVGDKVVVFGFTGGEAWLNGVWNILSIPSSIKVTIDAPRQSTNLNTTGYIAFLSLDRYLSVNISDTSNTPLLKQPLLYSVANNGDFRFDLSRVFRNLLSSGNSVDVSQEFDVSIVDKFRELNLAPLGEESYAAVASNSGFDRLISLDSSYGDVTSLLAVGQNVFIDFLGGETNKSITAWYEITKDISFDGSVTKFVVNGGLLTSSAVPVSVNIIGLELPTLQAIFARKQLLSEGGSAMWDNLLRPTGVATDDSLGKLLTRFEKPIMWRGWKRTVSWLIDSNYETRNGTSVNRIDADNYDINKNQINYLGNLWNQSVLTQGARVQTAALLETGAAFEGVRATLDGVQSASEILFFEIRNECPRPVMLEWINQLGGTEQHLFSLNQEFSDNVDEGVTVERAITEDIEFVTQTKRRFSRESNQRIRLKAEKIPFDLLKGLHEIKQSETVRLFLTKDGSEFIEAVVINTFSTTYQTNKRVFDFDVEVELPSNFDFLKGKKY